MTTKLKRKTPLDRPQKVKIEREIGSWYYVRALYPFSGWQLMAEVRGYSFARKVAKLVREEGRI